MHLAVVAWFSTVDINKLLTCELWCHINPRCRIAVLVGPPQVTPNIVVFTTQKDKYILHALVGLLSMTKATDSKQYAAENKTAQYLVRLFTLASPADVHHWSWEGYLSACASVTRRPRRHAHRSQITDHGQHATTMAKVDVAGRTGCEAWHKCLQVLVLYWNL